MVNTSPSSVIHFVLLTTLCSHNMASISQGLVFTTAMVLSTTVIYLAFSRPKTSPPFQIPANSNSPHSDKQILRSCLYSEEKKRKRKNNKKKKKVKFAENVMVKEEIRQEQGKQNRVSSSSICRNEIPEIRRMPANRIALCNGILRDRGHRIASCH